MPVFKKGSKESKEYVESSPSAYAATGGTLNISSGEFERKQSIRRDIPQYPTRTDTTPSPTPTEQQRRQSVRRDIPQYPTRTTAPPSRTAAPTRYTPADPRQRVEALGNRYKGEPIKSKRIVGENIEVTTHRVTEARIGTVRYVITKDRMTKEVYDNKGLVEGEVTPAAMPQQYDLAASAAEGRKIKGASVKSTKDSVIITIPVREQQIREKHYVLAGEGVPGKKVEESTYGIGLTEAATKYVYAPVARAVGLDKMLTKKAVRISDKPTRRERAVEVAPDIVREQAKGRVKGIVQAPTMIIDFPIEVGKQIGQKAYQVIQEPTKYALMAAGVGASATYAVTHPGQTAKTGIAMVGLAGAELHYQFMQEKKLTKEQAQKAGMTAASYAELGGRIEGSIIGTAATSGALKIATTQYYKATAKTGFVGATKETIKVASGKKQITLSESLDAFRTKAMGGRVKIDTIAKYQTSTTKAAGRTRGVTITEVQAPLQKTTRETAKLYGYDIRTGKDASASLTGMLKETGEYTITLGKTRSGKLLTLEKGARTVDVFAQESTLLSRITRTVGKGKETTRAEFGIGDISPGARIYERLPKDALSVGEGYKFIDYRSASQVSKEVGKQHDKFVSAAISGAVQTPTLVPGVKLEAPKTEPTYAPPPTKTATMSMTTPQVGIVTMQKQDQITRAITAPLQKQEDVIKPIQIPGIAAFSKQYQETSVIPSPKTVQTPITKPLTTPTFKQKTITLAPPIPVFETKTRTMPTPEPPPPGISTAIFPTPPPATVFGGGIVPPPGLPSIPTGAWYAGRGKKGKKAKRKYRYTPSLAGIYLGKTIKEPTQDIFTGQEIRPMLEPKKRKR